MNTEPPIVISLGGSLIVPKGGIDVSFLKKFNAFVRKNIADGKRFFIVAGGGNTCRDYQDAGRKVTGSISNVDLDWIGIHATRLNAHLMRTIFQDISHSRIVVHYNKILGGWTEPVAIGAGWKPGWSTDYCTMCLVRDYKAKMVINLSNIDWVYTKDPRKHIDAKKIEKMTWIELQNLIGRKWVPGNNVPFDPSAVQLGKELGAKVIITGADFDNLQKIVSGESQFNGTVVAP